MRARRRLQQLDIATDQHEQQFAAGDNANAGLGVAIDREPGNAGIADATVDEPESVVERAVGTGIADEPVVEIIDRKPDGTSGACHSTERHVVAEVVSDGIGDHRPAPGRWWSSQPTAGTGTDVDRRRIPRHGRAAG